MQNRILEQFDAFVLIGKEHKTSCNKKWAQFIYPIPPSMILNVSKNAFLTSEPQFLWKKANEKIFFHVFGRIGSEKVFGFNKLMYSKETFDSLRTDFISNQDESIRLNIPLFCGTDEFADFSKNPIWNDLTGMPWFMPKFTILQNPDGAWLAYNFSLEMPVSDIREEFKKYILFFEHNNDVISKTPVLSNRKDISKKEWADLVNNALKEISAGSFRKVVLSRKTEFDIEGSLSLDLLEDIAAKYPDCTVFLNKNNNSVFFGITPEKLLKISKGEFETDSLAGSIKRSSDGGKDKSYSEQLLKSGKDITEQKVVTDYILSIVNKYASSVSYNSEPELARLENIQHLKTVIKGTIDEDKFFIDLVKELHPTPAVCGFPKEAALNFILKNEPYERGLYSGIAGWFNLYGEGEFDVAIRSALIKEKKLYAFAGCGIVDGSIADSEFEETEIKFKPIFSIFGYENRNK